jgi:hypothetical protein
VKRRPVAGKSSGGAIVFCKNILTMKKLQVLCAVVLALGLAMSAAAQSHIGLRAAANLSNVKLSGIENGSEMMEPESRLGFGMGLVAEIGVSEVFAVQPELLYTQYGYRFDETFLGEKIEGKFRYSYLQVPLLGKLSFGSDAVKVNVLAGPHFGYGIGDMSYEVKAGEFEEKETLAWKDAETNRLDYGLTGGLGLTFGKISLDARYQFGLANLVEDPVDNEKMANRNFQVGLTYFIPLGR